MTVQYNVKADVLDITQDNPRKEDIFFVDTNVWFWFSYTKASTVNSSRSRYQVKDYPSYINKTLQNKSQLFCCGLSLMELIHNIERAEREIDIKRRLISPQTRPKEYRHNYPKQRQNVVQEIQTACQLVQNVANE